jgi:hypothetical protein
MLTVKGAHPWLLVRKAKPGSMFPPHCAAAEKGKPRKAIPSANKRSSTDFGEGIWTDVLDRSKPYRPS